MGYIISVAHDLFPDDCISGKPFELDKGGWYKNFILGISKYYKLISIHPTMCDRIITVKGNNFILIKMPTDLGKAFSKFNSFLLKLSIDLRIDNISLQAYDIAYVFSQKVDGIVYLHEFRRKAGTLIALKKLKNIPVILQHHSSKSPRRLLSSSFVRKSYWYYIDSLIRGLKKAVVFALSEEEKRYVEENYPNLRVYLRPMFADYNMLKPPSDEEKVLLRQKWGFKDDDIIILTYGATPKYRGIQFLHILVNKLNLKNIKIVVAGVPTEWISPLRRRNIIAFPRLTTDTYYELLRLSDVYLLLLSSALKPLGISVSAMEAFAVGLPVISPSLIHFPEKDKIKYIGRIIPYIDKLDDVMKVIPILDEVVRSLDSFKRLEIRLLTSKYYSLESFIKTLDDAIKYLKTL